MTTGGPSAPHDPAPAPMNCSPTPFSPVQTLPIASRRRDRRLRQPLPAGLDEPSQQASRVSADRQLCRTATRPSVAAAPGSATAGGGERGDGRYVLRPLPGAALAAISALGRSPTSPPKPTTADRHPPCPPPPASCRSSNMAAHWLAAPPGRHSVASPWTGWRTSGCVSPTRWRGWRQTPGGVCRPEADFFTFLPDAQAFAATKAQR